VNLLHFIGAFHAEVSRMLDAVDSHGEAGGLMEWANGRVGNYEVYFLWFPKTRRLVCTVRGPGVNKDETVAVKSSLDAIALAEQLIRRLRK
jgi:hypothetical protein